MNEMSPEEIEFEIKIEQMQLAESVKKSRHLWGECFINQTIERSEKNLEEEECMATRHALSHFQHPDDWPPPARVPYDWDKKDG